MLVACGTCVSAIRRCRTKRLEIVPAVDFDAGGLVCLAVPAKYEFTLNIACNQAFKFGVNVVPDKGPIARGDTVEGDIQAAAVSTDCPIFVCDQNFLVVSRNYADMWAENEFPIVANGLGKSVNRRLQWVQVGPEAPGSSGKIGNDNADSDPVLRLLGQKVRPMNPGRRAGKIDRVRAELPVCNI